MDGYEYSKEGDFKTLTDVHNAEDCQVKCYYETGNDCNFFSYDTIAKKCYLKRTMSGIVRSNQFQSGPKTCLDKRELQQYVQYCVITYY